VQGGVGVLGGGGDEVGDVCCDVVVGERVGGGVLFVFVGVDEVDVGVFVDL